MNLNKLLIYQRNVFTVNNCQISFVLWRSTELVR